MPNAKMASSSSSSSTSSSSSLRTHAPVARTLSPSEADVELKMAVDVSPVCSCEDVSYVSNLGVSSGWVTVVAVSTSPDSMGQVKTTTHAGRGEAVMMSARYIYVSATNWDYTMLSDGEPRDGQWTVVLQFALALGSPTFSRLYTVPGSIVNQFALDEHEGHLRIATTWGDMWRDPPTSVSNVYIYDTEDGRQAGKVEGLAPGERIYAVRFAGDTGYIVTFRQVDPLFVLDLSDAAHPLVRGQLKIPGFSEYLHPISSSLLLGLGKDTEDDANGGALVLGVKLSLFDVGKPEKPVELASMIVGHRGTNSLASYDHKAFLFHPASGLLVLPMQVWERPKGNEERYSEEVVFDGAYLFYIHDQAISLYDKVSHQSDKMPKGWRWGYGNGERQIYRSVYMDANLVTISDRHVQIYDLANKAKLRDSSLNLTRPQCLAQPPDFWTNVVY